MGTVNRVLSQSFIDTQSKAHLGINWSKYAYTQYVTDPTYLCNSLMIFETLHRLGSKADRLMMYPEQWSAESNTSEAGLLRKARDEYNVKLQPVQVKRFENDGSTWAESFTKLFAFNQTQYQRVISLDSDATVLQSMDELFFLPRAPVAMPRAYWIDDIFSTQIVVIEPSALEFERIQHAFEHRTMIEFDMEIMNKLYSQDCLILPHRRYDLVTGEFRSKEHDRYLGSSNEVWDARKVLEEVGYLHFSD
ncbi:nucleotide-diphospho-sugar transferase [Aureobasidium pullulans]|uniref:Nucleotide-diphospho-sugar transferase n=1 Tax=Aureobasidium pullulans TaxID=5580 RepID=A0A4S9T2S4_AURPU|nr:nucleotide-diphospho-sugar transferase [Aureobasidium pullulans]